MSNKINKIVTVVAIFIASLPLTSRTVYAQDPQISQYLSIVQQNLQLTDSNIDSICDLSAAFGKLDNETSCNGVKASACDTTLIYFVSLQDLIIRGSLSSQNSIYIQTREQIQAIRSKSGCLG
jgi:hypothetical protein